jgi:hypothetical protein
MPAAQRDYPLTGYVSEVSVLFQTAISTSSLLFQPKQVGRALDFEWG